MSNILMVVTAANTLTLGDGTAHATGFWAEELVVAHRSLVRAGHSVQLATPGGAAAPVDPGSLNAAIVGSDARVREFEDYLQSIHEELSHPLALADVIVDEFDAVVLPGGHGPMADLAFDADLGRILIRANDASLPIAPFCHGPAGLLSAATADGEFAFSGRRLTVFTDEEELTGGIGERTPWLVATTLRERGAIVEGGPAWTSHVVRDGNLITGQNPQSSEAVADALLDVLGR